MSGKDLELRIILERIAKAPGTDRDADISAFMELVNGRLIRLAARERSRISRIRRRVSPEDVAQNAALDVIQVLRAIAPDDKTYQQAMASIDAFLRMVLRGESNDLIRKHGAKKRSIKREEQSGVEQAVPGDQICRQGRHGGRFRKHSCGLYQEVAAAHATTKTRTQERRTRAKAMAECLKDLPAEQAYAVWQVDALGRTRSEVAYELGYFRDKLNTLLEKARRTLRLWEEHGRAK